MARSNSIECNSIEGNLIECNLNNQQFIINKINEIKDFFIAEIKERELMSKIVNTLLVLIISIRF